MSDKAGYSSIPDVEEGVAAAPAAETTGSTPLDAVLQRYPEANEMEAKFLGILDDAMEKATPEIEVPRIQADDVGPPDDPLEFVSSLVLPTIAFGVTAATAFGVAVLNSPVAMAIYPYFTAVLSFLSTVPPTKKRFMKQAGRALAKIDMVRDEVESKVETVNNGATGAVDSAEAALDKALAPMKDKLAIATKAETVLRTFDPDIDIPDTTDIEEGFDGFADKLHEGFASVKGAVDTSKQIPKALQSKPQFEKRVFYPFMAVFLVLQLVGAYTSSQSEPAVATSAPVTAEPSVPAVVQGLFNSTVDNVEDAVSNLTLGDNTVFAGVNTTQDDEDDEDSKVDDNEEDEEEEDLVSDWTLYRSSIQSYISAVIQMIVAFLLTRAATFALGINAFIAKTEKDVNDILDKYLGSAFRLVFEEGFGRVRELMLKLIRKVEKIEGPLKKLQSAPIPGALAAKADEAKEQAGEAMKKASGLMGRFGSFGM